MRTRHIPAVMTAIAVLGCGPKAPPLTGTGGPARIPRAELPPLHRRITFTWRYREPDYSARGDGVARIAPPDSVRLDFFLQGSDLGGRALLIGDRLHVPGGALVRGILPPVPLLWATFGRLHVPASPDTVVRVDGDTLRADIGQDSKYRSTFVAEELRRLELIDGDRLQQWVNRPDSGQVMYRHERAGRVLELSVVRVDTVRAFNASIWR